MYYKFSYNHSLKLILAYVKKKFNKNIIKFKIIELYY
nr:MAG TPA: hypothetical protein [Caudoviricetes sp.]